MVSAALSRCFLKSLHPQALPPGVGGGSSCGKGRGRGESAGEHRQKGEGKQVLREVPQKGGGGGRRPTMSPAHTHTAGRACVRVGWGCGGKQNKKKGGQVSRVLVSGSFGGAGKQCWADEKGRRRKKKRGAGINFEARGQGHKGRGAGCEPQGRHVVLASPPRRARRGHARPRCIRVRRRPTAGRHRRHVGGGAAAGHCRVVGFDHGDDDRVAVRPGSLLRGFGVDPLHIPRGVVPDEDAVDPVLAPVAGLRVGGGGGWAGGGGRVWAVLWGGGGCPLRGLAPCTHPPSSRNPLSLSSPPPSHTLTPRELA